MSAVTAVSQRYTISGSGVRKWCDGGRIIGMKGIVTEDIIKDNIGEVKADGKKWSAYSDTDISKGENIKVWIVYLNYLTAIDAI